MIAQLRGIILEKTPPQLLLDVQGVGYEINAPMSTFYRLADVGKEVVLLTHFIVREDAHTLYGFSTSEERTLFRTLLKVNGIGPKLALTILSSIEPNEFVQNITHSDAQSLVRIPGVGKKTAERLVVEMRDKLSAWEVSSPSSFFHSNKIEVSPQNQMTQDAISALIALGYKPQEASRAVAKVSEGLLNSEEMIRQALREMVV